MRGYTCIGLHQPKNKLNVGSVLRAAACYEAAMVAVSGQRYGGLSATDTSKTYRHIPLLQVDNLYDVMPFDCVPVAVDLVPGARCLTKYTHLERAFYIFGPEDGTLDETVLKWCHHAIQVPTSYCMNLAATVNVVLYDRMAKNSR